MQRLPQDDLRTALSLTHDDGQLDNQTALRLKRKLAEEFRDQLTIGVPTNADEAGLGRLAGQIKNDKLAVKLFLRHPLHDKLYLLFRTDPINPIVGYLGSSNLTLAGLSHHGELNVDVLDHDALRTLRAGLRGGGPTNGASTSPLSLFKSLRRAGRARCRCRRTTFM
jgi:PLD-like domain